MKKERKTLKVFSVILLFLFLSFPVFSQSNEDAIKEVLTDYPALLSDYEELLDDYDSTLSDYDTLLTDYDNLLTEYQTLDGEYTDLKNAFTRLDGLYNNEIGYHENSIKALDAANKSILALESSVEDLLSITDTRYMALYLQGGYAGDKFTVGLGFTARIPKLPISFIVDIDYLHGLDFPINIQAGIGLRF